jgi:hypothetical protein
MSPTSYPAATIELQPRQWAIWGCVTTIYSAALFNMVRTSTNGSSTVQYRANFRSQFVERKRFADHVNAWV